MAFAPQPYSVVNGLAGLLIAGLGAYVLSVRHRTRGNTAFGAFMVLFGLGYFLNHLVYSMDVGHDDAHWAAALVPWGGAAILLGFVAVWFPEPMRRGQTRWALVIAVLGLVTLALVLMAELPPWMSLTADGAIGWASMAGFCAFSALITAVHAFSVMIAMRYGRTGDPRMQRRLALAGIAIGVYVASVAGSGAFTLGASVWSPAHRAWSALNLVWVAWAAAWWLRHGRTGITLVAASTLIGVTLLGLLIARNGDVVLGFKGVFHGMARLTAFVILVYAILKDHLLGIDLRARATVKTSTYGAAGIATFFIISEGSASFFSDRLGPIIGLTMAAGIVALMVPLHQRVERLAARAVPVGSAAEFYRDQARIAWSDGAMTARERRMLHELRDQLGIPAEQAMALEAEALTTAADPAARRLPPHAGL